MIAECYVTTGNLTVYNWDTFELSFRPSVWNQWTNSITCKIFNTRRTNTQILNVSRLLLQLPLPNLFEARCYVENEDAVGAAPTGDAPTISEWSTILLPTKVSLISEVWLYLVDTCDTSWCLPINQFCALTSPLWSEGQIESVADIYGKQTSEKKFS